MERLTFKSLILRTFTVTFELVHAKLKQVFYGIGHAFTSKWKYFNARN